MNWTTSRRSAELGDRLDVPRQHLVALHARDFARAPQQQRHAAQLALHDFEVQQRHLAHQAGADADLREHLRGVEQFAFGLGPRLFPRQLHRAVRRQVAGEVAARALGPGRAGELELRVRAQPLQDDRLQHAGGDAEIHRVPGLALADGGVELELDGELAAVVEHGDEAVLLDPDAPLRMRGGVGERDRAGEQVERAALGVLHPRGGGEGEGGLVAAEVADQLEVVERDRGRRRIRRRVCRVMSSEQAE